MPEEYEGTPCLDLVTGSPSTLLIHRGVASCPPPLEGQAGIFQPPKLIPRKGPPPGLCSGEKTQREPRRLQDS